MRDDDQVPGEVEPADRRHQFRVAVLVGVFVVFAAIALDNRQRVTVGWVIGDARVPLVVALVASFVAGGVVGTLASRRRHRD